MLREDRELRIELELNARGKEGESFQEALDLGVGALETFQAETTGDLREFSCELAAHLADVLKFAVVMLEQARIHAGQPRFSETLKRPVSRSTSVFR